MTSRCLAAPIAATVLVLLAASPVAAKPILSDTGPSTVTGPYVLPVADGVRITSLLTVDDAGAASDGYELTGTPDGLGAVEDGHHRFKLFMNHELKPVNLRFCIYDATTTEILSGELQPNMEVVTGVTRRDFAHSISSARSLAGVNR